MPNSSFPWVRELKAWVDGYHVQFTYSPVEDDLWFSLPACTSTELQSLAWTNPALRLRIAPDVDYSDHVPVGKTGVVEDSAGQRAQTCPFCQMQFVDMALYEANLENLQLRRLLAYYVSGGLVTFQETRALDTSDVPHIDFQNEPLEIIKEKLRGRFLVKHSMFTGLVRAGHEEP